MTTLNKLEVRIYADKSGPEPKAGEPWPVAGMDFIDSSAEHGPPGVGTPIDAPDEIQLSTRWVQEYAARGVVEVVGAGWVTRPSRPDPDVDQNGSPAVSMAHKRPGEGPVPHEFMHAEKLVFDTRKGGKVTYVVAHQPDKYVDSDDPTEQVTLDAYAEGRTRVDHFYICRKES